MRQQSLVVNTVIPLIARFPPPVTTSVVFNMVSDHMAPLVLSGFIVFAYMIKFRSSAPEYMKQTLKADEILGQKVLSVQGLN